MYRLAEAARVADAPEEELLRAIEDGLLLARRQQNTGEYAVHSEELARWVKRSRRAGRLGQVKKKKVLLLSEDMLFSGTLKLELGRHEHIDARWATWGKDAILMVNHYRADLILVDLSPSKVPPDEVLAALASARREEGAPAVLATCLGNPEALASQPLVQARLKTLSPEAFVPRAGSVRPLLVALFGILGLQTRTGMIRLQA